MAETLTEVTSLSNMTVTSGNGSGQTKSALLFLCVALVLVLIYLALAPFNIADGMSPWLDTDYGMLTNNGLRILKGDLLYKDIWSFYTPAASYVVALIFKMFGDSLRALRLVLAFAGVSTALLVFYFARSLTSTILAAGVTALAILLGPVCVNYPYPSWFCVPLGLFMVFLEHFGWEKKSRIYRLAAGAMAGMAFSFKVNFGVLTFASLLCIQSVEPLLSADDLRLGPKKAKSVRMLVAVLLVAVPLGSIVLIRNKLTLTNLAIFSLPAVLVALTSMTLLLRRIREGKALTSPFSPMFLSVVGFAIVVLPWTILFLARLGAGGFYQAIIYPLSFFSRIAYRGLPARTLPALLLIFLCAFQGVLILRREVSAYVRSAFLVVLWFFELLLAWKMVPFLTEGLLGTGTSLYSKWGLGLAGYVPLAVHIGIAFVLVRDLRDETTDRRQIHLLTCLWIYSVLVFHTFYPLMEPHHLIWNMSPVVILACVFIVRSLEFWESKPGHSFSGFRKGLKFCSALVVPVFLTLFFGLPFFSYFVRVKSSPFKVQFTEFSDIDTPRGGILMPRHLATITSETVRYIESHTEPDEFIFDATGSFFYFLTDRPNPTRWGHFVEGFMSPRDVAEIMQQLETSSPRVAVTSYAADVHLSIDQPDLYGYIRARYKPVKTFGDYRILVLNEPGAKKIK